MDPDLNIVVICGGSSAEAEVSRVSAAGVRRALEASFTRVETLELDANLAPRLLQLRPDVVFPVLHGPPGEDGTVQGFLEVLGLPYVGSDVHASASAMDKVIAKQFFRLAGLPVADDAVVATGEDLAVAADRIERSLGYPLVVKPCRQGSSLGVTLAANANELHGGLRLALAMDSRILVERRIPGREITCGVLDVGPGPVACPVIEIVTPEDTWYDFEHRYTPGLSRHLLPAPLPAGVGARVQEMAVRAHLALGCRDLSRSDFVVTEGGEICLLELNSLPGMTPTSLYPEGVAALGVSFEQLVFRLAHRAWARRQRT
jgi:D-alanine-D-alanine ligase